MARATNAILPTFLVLSAACADGDVGLDSSDASVPAAPRLEAVEVVRFGGAATGEGDLTRITSVLPLPDGGFILNDDVRRLLRFDSSATPVGEVGREGEGPGEFTLVTDLGARGDSLWIADPVQRRITVFDPSGAFVRVVSPRTEFGDAPYDPFSSVRGLLTDGRRVVVPNPLPGRASELGPTVPWVLTDADGVVLDSLGRSASFGGRFITEWGSYAGQPFTPPPWTGLSDAGRLVEVTPVADSSSFGVVVRIVDPDRVRMDTLRFPMPEVDPLWLDSVIAERTTAFKETLDRFQDVAGESPPASEIESALRESMYAPRWTPPIRGVRVAVDGTVWLEGTASDGQRPWYRLDAEGRPDGHLLLPEAHAVRGVTRDRLWTVTVDELDVPLLSVLEVREAGP